MNNPYNLCYKGGFGRLEEKKSVFLCDVRPVHTEEQVNAFLEEIKKKYWDASHHCYAYILGGPMEVKKFTDAGEPSGTAGKPMLDVLEGMNLKDVMVIVTRYFGGTLLGTGGLVRAYQGACKEGLKNAQIVMCHEGTFLHYLIDYDFYGRVQKLTEKERIFLVSSEFSDVVNITLAVDKSDEVNIINKVEEMSAAKAKLIDSEDANFILIDGKVFKV